MVSRLYAAQALLEDKSRTSLTFTEATSFAYAKPMFLSVWTTMLAVFSVVFKASSDPHVVRVSLDGYAHAIHISCFFNLDLQRNAFIQSLIQFSGLLAPDKGLDTKKMECIKTLLHIATNHSNYLGPAWYQLLKLISQLDLAISRGAEDHLELEPVMSDASLDGGDLASARKFKDSFIFNPRPGYGKDPCYLPALAPANVTVVYIGQAQPAEQRHDTVNAGEHKHGRARGTRWRCQSWGRDVCAEPRGRV